MEFRRLQAGDAEGAYGNRLGREAIPFLVEVQNDSYTLLLTSYSTYTFGELDTNRSFQGQAVPGVDEAVEMLEVLLPRGSLGVPQTADYVFQNPELTAA